MEKTERRGLASITLETPDIFNPQSLTLTFKNSRPCHNKTCETQSKIEQKDSKEDFSSSQIEELLEEDESPASNDKDFFPHPLNMCNEAMVIQNQYCSKYLDEISTDNNSYIAKSNFTDNVGYTAK